MWALVSFGLLWLVLLPFLGSCALSQAHPREVDAVPPKSALPWNLGFERDRALFPPPCPSRCFSLDKNLSTIQRHEKSAQQSLVRKPSSLPDLFSVRSIFKNGSREMDMPAVRADRQPGDPGRPGFSIRSNSRVSRLNMSFSENRPTFPAHAPAPVKPRERDRHGTSASGRGIFASRRAADAVQAASPTDAAPLPPLPDLPPRDVLFLSLSDPQYSDFLAAGNSRTQFSPELT